MFFPQAYWWDSCGTAVPDGVKYLCERWWELLKDWFCVTVYSPRCSYHLSLLEDLSDIIEDLQEGRLRSSRPVEAAKEEVLLLLCSDHLLRKAFPAEVGSVVVALNSLFNNLPPSPQNQFAELKKRKTECRRAAMAARRLHHRCLRRRMAEQDMTWTGLGGLIGAELFREVLAQQPDHGKIDRLTNQLLLDCLYRGYDINYLTTLFDRYLSVPKECRDNLLHAFRRIQSRQRHQYLVYFVLVGASELRTPANRGIEQVTWESLDSQGIDPEILSSFKGQCQARRSMLLRVERSEDLDAGAAAEAARKEVQEIVDFLDFDAPMQQFELAPLSLVTWADPDERHAGRLHPDTSGQMPPRSDYIPELEPEWVERLKSLSEALRWSAVARHERTPEVSLLASWFAFEFLAADIGATPVEGIMEFFPKALAIGNIRRRLEYWYRSLQGSPGFDGYASSEKLDEVALHYRGAMNHSGILHLLRELTDSPDSEQSKAVREIAASSVLLRERTAQESRLFGNPKLLAQTMSDECRATRWDLQRFLYVRNKLVHRARIDHPLLVVLSTRAKRLLYDLLRDLAFQMGGKRLHSDVGEVLHDFRDTFDEMLADLGQSDQLPQNFTDRVLLA